MVKIIMLVDGDGEVRKGDILSVSPEIADGLLGDGKAELVRETRKDGKFL